VRITPFFTKPFICAFLLIISASTLRGQAVADLEKRIDSVVVNAIQQKAFPGCVVYAAHKGKPFFSKAYGHLTYDSVVAVQLTTLYDLASLTKVTAAGLCLMKLYEEDKIELDDSLGSYVRGLNPLIGQLTLRELMTHQSGLPPGVRFHQRILGEEVAAGQSPFGLRRNNRYEAMKVMINEIKELGEKKFTYSDLFFLMVPELVQNVSGQSFESYLNEYFYQPLGVELTYHAGQTHSVEMIAPTELDTVYHKHLMHGQVHDESAALMGGVSGNAGLFGNILDVARVWQMLLNKGEYQGKEYLRPETVALFTRTHFQYSTNHRGLVFDKPPNDYNPERSQMAQMVSEDSYGHTGFTGTMVWADPQSDLLFVFLSNRVHPFRSPNLLLELRVRPILHQYFLVYLN
jgi:CubicO group peptidase (beta-lactamase class C family)